jgi:predicted RNA-binding protein with PUA-like domain
MNYWLFSTEPDSYPWQKVEAAEKAMWDGIRGGAAQKSMRLIRPGDEILAYHSAPEKAVVGIAEARSTSYSDPSVPTDEKDKWHVIDVGWKRWLQNPVPIAQMRSAKGLSKMKFLIMPRLSISPVTSAEWATILRMGSE